MIFLKSKVCQKRYYLLKIKYFPSFFDHVSPVHCYITWKINVKEILSEDCFVEFIVETRVSLQYIYTILKYLSVKLIYDLIYSTIKD